MRLRVVSCCIIVIIMLVIGFVCCDYAYAYDIWELYEREARFTSYIDENGDSRRIIYATNTKTGRLHLQILVNGEYDSRYDWEVGVENYNKSYFYIENKPFVDKNGILKARVTFMRYGGNHPGKYADRYIVNGNTVGGLTFPPTGYDEIEEFLKGKVIITIPAYDGFKDTMPVQVIWFNYGVPLPSSGNPADISISIEGGVSGSGEVISQSGYISDGYYYGHVKVTRELNTGVNTIIVKVKSNDVTYTASRVIERLIGVIDEDGDGYDDRTGLPIWQEYPDIGDDYAPQPPGSEATIIDYIKYLVDSVQYAMSQLVAMLKGFMGGLAQLTQIFTEFFSFMPTQFSGIIILGLIMAVILRVVGR